MPSLFCRCKNWGSEMKALAHGHTDNERQSQDVGLNCSSSLQPRLLSVPQDTCQNRQLARQQVFSKRLLSALAACKKYSHAERGRLSSLQSMSLFQAHGQGTNPWKIRLEFTLLWHPCNSKEKLKNTSEVWLFFWKFLFFCRFPRSVYLHLVLEG